MQTSSGSRSASPGEVLPPAAALAQATSLTEALQASARRHLEAVALQDGERQVTYAQLWSDVRSFAHTLSRRGVGAGRIVAVRVPRGWRQVVAICAVLAAGGTYVPVDPAYPPASQRYMLNDAGAAAVIDLRDGEFVVADIASSAPEPPPGTAYILYTSGSTGSPKGVLVGHTHVLALLRSCVSLFDVGERDSWTLYHSCSFDFSVWEVWGCLLTGGRLVIVDHATATDPDAFVDLLATQDITVLSLVPSVFAVVFEHVELTRTRLPSLR